MARSDFAPSGAGGERIGGPSALAAARAARAAGGRGRGRGGAGGRGGSGRGSSTGAVFRGATPKGGTSGMKGGGYSLYGRGGRGRGSGAPSALPKKPPANEANFKIFERLRACADYKIHALQDDRPLRSAANGVYNHAAEIVCGATAQQVKGIGPTIAKKVGDFLAWHAAAALVATTVFVVGRFENAEKDRWWRIEWVGRGPSEDFVVRRSWGMLKTVGFDECFKDFASAEARHEAVETFIKGQVRQGYRRCDDDIGDVGGVPEEDDDDEEEEDAPALSVSDELADIYGGDVLKRRAADRARAEDRAVRRGEGVAGKVYRPDLIRQRDGQVQAVAAMLVAMHRHALARPEDPSVSKDDICALAQPLCPETPMRADPAAGAADATKFYGGISSFATLLKKQVVEPWPTKKRFRLTDVPGEGKIAGVKLAQDLHDELKRHTKAFQAFQAPFPSSTRPAAGPPPTVKRPRLNDPPSTRGTCDDEPIDLCDDEDDDMDFAPRDAEAQAAAHRQVADTARHFEEEAAAQEPASLDAPPPPPPPPPSPPPSDKNPGPRTAGAFDGEFLRAQRARYVGDPRPFDEVFEVTLVVDSREKRQMSVHEADAIVGKLCSTVGAPLRVRKKPLDFADYVWIVTAKGTFEEAWDREGLLVGRTIERKCASDLLVTVKRGTHHSKQRLAMRCCPAPTYLVEGDFDGFSQTDASICITELAGLELRDGFSVHRSGSFELTIDYLALLDRDLRARLAQTTAAALVNGNNAASEGHQVAAYADLKRAMDQNKNTWPLWRLFALALCHVPRCTPLYARHIVAKYPTPNLLFAALDAHGNDDDEPLLARILDPPRVLKVDARAIAAFFTEPAYAALPRP